MGVFGSECCPDFSSSVRCALLSMGMEAKAADRRRLVFAYYVTRHEFGHATSVVEVSDVAPMACKAAADAGIRSVCVTKFSWDFIYAEYVMAAGSHHSSIVWQISGARRLAIIVGYQLYRVIPRRDVHIPQCYSLAENEEGLSKASPVDATQPPNFLGIRQIREFEILHGDIHGFPNIQNFFATLASDMDGILGTSPTHHHTRKHMAAAARFNWEVTGCKVNMIMLLIYGMLQACEGLSWPEMPTHIARRALVGAGQNATGNQTWGSFPRMVEFDIMIMVTILMAVLLILLCTWAVRLILRHAYRYRGRFPFESEEAFTARLALIGLKKGDMELIPTIIYRARETDIQEMDCPICLGDFEEGDIVRVLPKCCHSFHVNCIDSWLKSHPSCPNCREIVRVVA